MSFELNTPVALIFFNRPDTLEKVFEQVKIARPKQLFLIQDGPRNEADKEKIMQCRQIVEQVDWECEVHKDYSEVNLGCGVRPQSGITNALKVVDRIIILEDDCVPAQSFFRYCQELLEKYKDDERVCYVSGLNHFENWDCGESDYFFTKTGAIWGWATWSRAWNKYYDYYVSAVENKETLDLVKNQIRNKYVAEDRAKAWVRANKSKQNNEKLSYWDAQWGFIKYAQNMLVIVPKYNQIHNIGIGATSTHAQATNSKKYKKGKSAFFIPTTELEFPLKHPEIMVCDEKYDDMVYKCAVGNPIRRFVAKIVKKILKRK